VTTRHSDCIRFISPTNIATRENSAALREPHSDRSQRRTQVDRGLHQVRCETATAWSRRWSCLPGIVRSLARAQPLWPDCVVRPPLAPARSRARHTVARPQWPKASRDHPAAARRNLPPCERGQRRPRVVRTKPGSWRAVCARPRLIGTIPEKARPPTAPGCSPFHANLVRPRDLTWVRRCDRSECGSRSAGEFSPDVAMFDRRDEPDAVAVAGRHRPVLTVELALAAADRPAALPTAMRRHARRAWRSRRRWVFPLDEHELLVSWLLPRNRRHRSRPSLRPQRAKRRILPSPACGRGAAQGEGLGSLLLINHTSRRVASTTSGSAGRRSGLELR